MKENYIAVFDSGIGGLTVLDELSNRLPNRNFIYIADNKNTPYGNLSSGNLLRLTLDSLCILKNYNIKALVLGCNTISVSIRDKLQDYFDFPVFGVFPPVEKFLMGNKRVLLLATQRTVGSFENNKNLVALGLPNLAKDIEENAFNLEKINILDHIPRNLLNNNAFDKVVLGCTHYIFIKNKILDHFCPKKVVSGNHFAVNFIAKYFENTNSLGFSKQNSILFLGDNANKNQKIYYEVVKKS